MSMTKRYAESIGFFDRPDEWEPLPEPQEEWEIVGAPTPFENHLGRPLNAMDLSELTPTLDARPISPDDLPW